MALSVKTQQAIVRLARLRIHPAIIARLVDCDPRVVGRLVKAHVLHYARPELPQTTPSSHTLKQIAAQLRGDDLSKLRMLPDSTDPPVVAANSFYRTVIEQQEYLDARES